MRTRRRIALLLASAAALGVGLIAFPASSAAVPPVVNPCVPKPSSGSDSCVTLQVGQATGVGPIGAAFENAKLGVRTGSVFSPANSETTTVTLRFDDDLKVNLAAVAGTCTAASLTGDTIQQAYNQCGPGPGGSNTYLSPAGNVSGVSSTVVAGIDACTMAFKGANANQIILYARAPIGVPSTECNSPATNTGGTTTVLLTGTLSNQPPASPYGPTLTVPNTHVPNPSLDEFQATIVRGAAFQAKCPAGQSPHKLQGVFDYVGTAPTEPTDTISPPYAGTTEACNDVTPY